MMGKHLLNKGYTLIEMIFVLLIFNLSILFTLQKIPDLSNLKFNYVISLIRQAHMNSYANHIKSTIEIYDSNVYINETKYDISPLVCRNQYFHFNEQGNISNALTLTCYGNDEEYELRLQLGTGYLSYE